MADPEYIWITRWEDFQHYQPVRERGPAWIKDYTAQLDDERYLRLTDRQRALLRDLRDIFAASRGWVSHDAPMIARRRNAQTRHVDLLALNHAGFIEFHSRASLELTLEKFYASRAPARSQEVEEEKDTKTEKGSLSSNSKSSPTQEARPAGAYADELARLASLNGQGESNGTRPTADEPYFARLLTTVGDTEENFTKLRRASRGKPAAAIIVAYEAATNSTTRDPLAVALTVLSEYGNDT